MGIHDFLNGCYKQTKHYHQTKTLTLGLNNVVCTCDMPEESKDNDLGGMVWVKKWLLTCSTEDLPEDYLDYAETVVTVSGERWRLVQYTTSDSITIIELISPDEG